MQDNDDDTVKILIVTYLFPYPADSGYKLRVFNTIRELSRRNIVDLLCLEHRDISGEHLGRMSAYCGAIWLGKKPPLSFVRKAYRYLKAFFSGLPLSLVSSWDHEKKELIRKTSERTEYEVIIAEHLIAGHLVYQCGFHVTRRAITVMINHNVEHDLYANIFRNNVFLRPYHMHQAYLMRRYEKKINESFDLTVVMSEEDRMLFHALSPDVDPIVLPNGVCTEYFAMRREIPSNHDFYYAGNLNYYPNIDAVHYFMEEVFPRVKSRVADSRFFIVGGNPPEKIKRYHDGTNIFVTGYIEDIRELIGKCRVLVVPLRLGSGTRLKIVEAMSMGIPVVSTVKGAEGIKVTPNHDIILAGDTLSFAEGLHRLLTDDRFALSLAENARLLVERKYRWESIVTKLVDRVTYLRHNVGDRVSELQAVSPER